MSLYPSKGVDDLINDLNDLRKDQDFYGENLLNIKQKNLKLLQKALKAFSQDDGGDGNSGPQGNSDLDLTHLEQQT
jgi:hypothetical protein